MAYNFGTTTTKVNVSMGFNGIGVRLRVARITSGKTVAQLAEGVNLDPSTVYKYENGRIDFPNPENLFRIADFLEVITYWLMTGVGKPTDNAARNDAIQFCIESIANKVEPVSRYRKH